MAQQPISIYVGIGLSFPIQLENGKPVMSDINMMIEASIRNILIWPFNSRYFEKLFGSRINELIEEPHVYIVNSLLEEFIKDSLNMWETRINVLDVTAFSVEPGITEVKIKYEIKLTHTVQEVTQNIILN
jgi:phage baseplate assembly protein W